MPDSTTPPSLRRTGPPPDSLAFLVPAAAATTLASLSTIWWIGVAGLGSATGAGGALPGSPWLPGALAVALGFAATRLTGSRPRLFPIILGILIGVAVAYASAHVLTIASEIGRVSGWDIGGFVIYGQAGVRGTPYDVEFIRGAAAAYPVPTQSFAEELYPWYPPQSYLLFLPLGLIAGLSEAALFWYVVQGAALVAAIVLAWRVFLVDLDMLALPLAATLVLAFGPTFSMVAFGQTDGLMLVAALLLVATGPRPRAGVWLAAGLIVKPIFAAFWLVPLIRREWRTIVVAAAVFLVPTAAVLVLFGLDVVPAFLRNIDEIGFYKFTQTANASLNGILSRLPIAEGGAGGLRAAPLENPVFLGLTLALLLATIYLVDRRDKVSWALAIALVSPLGLLAYPGTLVHYTMLLVVPILVIWLERERLGIGSLTIAVLTFALLAIGGVDEGRLSAFASALMWIATAALVWRAVRAPAPIDDDISELEGTSSSSPVEVASAALRAS